MNDKNIHRHAAHVDRRDFLKGSMAAAAVGGTMLHSAGEVSSAYERAFVIVDDFDRPDSLYHGDGWESLNPGYWKIENKTLRRRLRNVGDRARRTGFPFHWETHQRRPMPVDYDPSLPFGMLWRRDWKLSGNYVIRFEATVKAFSGEPANDDNPSWKHFQPGYGLMGLCFGGQSLFESWHGRGKPGKAAWMAALRDDGRFGVYDHVTDGPRLARHGAELSGLALHPGAPVALELHVGGDDEHTAMLEAVVETGAGRRSLTLTDVDREKFTDGYFGLVARGLLDFAVERVELRTSGGRLDVPLNELHVAYPLGDTLRERNGRWQCRFVAMFRGDGRRAEIRLSDTPRPAEGWQRVAPAGSAPIVNNDFRRNSAVIDVTLPRSPAEATLYYTVWKDGRDVTADPRNGFLGRKDYVGRLPQLRAPYKLCGLSCHAINGPADLPVAGLFEENWIHDQPTPEAYKHLEEYGFQVMLWEDDVWYLELVLFTPSTDDAYKIITTTLAGPTTRWQMMRHWNILNPGDHDHGMDDVKGPEQIAVRNHADLGQDPEYMRRNFQIVSHLMRGDESPSATANPKRWRRWKMPDRDFTLLIIDSRLWRSSQDTHIWDDEGWGHKRNLYDRDDTTRSLLGEEQFAWLQEIIRTDSSPLICLTGINGLHTVWSGHKVDPHTGLRFNPRDRVAADYAGWVKAGSDRLIQLLGSRDGVVSVYGDVHNGCILKNVAHGLYECSFGPIGRYGGRSVKEDFGPKMTDYDGRPLEVIALYHRDYETPELHPIRGPKYWNFLEMHFDPRVERKLGIRIRNLIDPPTERPRGGGFVDHPIEETGRPVSCRLPELTLLPNADVHIFRTDGRPIRATRSTNSGDVPLKGLVDVSPGTRLVVSVVDGRKAEMQIVTTEPL